MKFIFFILFHILMKLYHPKKEMTIFDWFQGFSEAQMTKLKKNEHISAEREREIDQVIWRNCFIACRQTTACILSDHVKFTVGR